MESQFEQLSKGPDVVIATPGRLMHHLVEVKFGLKSVEYCVFDEADRLFEMGFALQLNEILKRMSDERQTCLFSATMPAMLVEFTRAGLRDPKLIRLDVEAKISENLRIQNLTLRSEEKPAALIYLIKELLSEEEQTVVFAATRHHVEFLYNLLQHAHISATAVYGLLDPAARKINIGKFRAKKCQVLVVTDVAARGIDIPLLDNVVNYDFPSKPKLFVHRVGRVARAGRSGSAYSLVSPDEMPYLVDLNGFLGKGLLNNVAEEEEYDEKTIYFGNFPRDPLREMQEYTKALIATHNLSAIQRTSNRAYKMYYKTRSGASKGSMKKVKELPAWTLHPMFYAKNAPYRDHATAKDVSVEDSKALDDFMNSIRTFRSSSTIFEVGVHNDEVMKKKRSSHGYLIRKNDLRLKVKDADVGNVTNTAKQTIQEMTLAMMGGKAGEEDTKNGDNNNNDSSNTAAPAANEKKEKKTGLSKLSSIMKKESNSNSKPRMSKRARAKLKKQQKQQQASSSKSNVNKNNTNDDNGKTASAPTPPTKKEKRSKKKDFRDPNFFLSGAPSVDDDDEIANKALMISDWTRSDDMKSQQTLMQEMVLDIGAEDAEGFAKARKVKKWDQKKRRYITETVGGNPFKKRKNESGVYIKDDKRKGPSLYEKWQRNTKKSVHSGSAMPEGAVSLDDILGDKSSRGKGGAAGALKDNRTMPSTKRKTKGGAGNKKDGRKVEHGLARSEAEIKKIRQERLKNIAKHQRGGRRGGRGGRR